jgi:hypothetical protein
MSVCKMSVCKKVRGKVAIIRDYPVNIHSRAPCSRACYLQVMGWGRIPDSELRQCRGPAQGNMGVEPSTH